VLAECARGATVHNRCWQNVPEELLYTIGAGRMCQSYTIHNRLWQNVPEVLLYTIGAGRMCQRSYCTQ